MLSHLYRNIFSFHHILAAFSVPSLVAIVVGSGVMPALGRSRRSESKQASMVGLPVLGQVVWKVQASFSKPIG